MNLIKLATAAVALFSLTACMGGPSREPLSFDELTESASRLHQLPPPSSQLVVAVYDFPDETGQYGSGDGVSNFSRAVTQGASAILIDGLTKAGDGSWFRVVERESFQNLLNERNVINEMRSRYASAETGQQLPSLGPLTYAGALFEGGVIGYDSNVRTGGIGARWLGIGPFTEYREDVITVYLRLTSTQTGEVVHSVVTRKTVFSILAGLNVFRYVAEDELLEIDMGISYNEPTIIALEQAIDQAVYTMIIEGAERGYWAFADAETQAQVVESYRQARARNAQAAVNQTRSSFPLAIGAPIEPY